MNYRFQSQKISSASSINKKMGKKNVIKIGYNFDYYITSYLDSIINDNDTINYDWNWNKRWEANSQHFLAQAYLQFKHKFNDNLILTAGIHSQYYSLSNEFSSFEPRLGIKWKINDNNSFSAGLGRHSQIQPMYLNFYHEYDQSGNKVYKNKELGMSYSNHAVVGYSHRFSKNIGFKMETYYQQLSNVPVEVALSSYSIINQGSGFSRLFPDSLENTGSGHNYGVEITLERYFSENWYCL